MICLSKAWCISPTWVLIISNSMKRHELRGERSGKRYQLTDKIRVQVSRVDMDARKIDLALPSEARRHNGIPKSYDYDDMEMVRVRTNASQLQKEKSTGSADECRAPQKLSDISLSRAKASKASKVKKAATAPSK